MEYLDFWSKYFANLSDNSKALKYSNQVNGGQASEDTESDGDSVGKIKNHANGSDRLSSQKWSRFYKRRLLNVKKRSVRGNSPIRKKSDRVRIQKIKIFDNELEKNFDLTENLKTFNLQIGKSKNEMAKSSFEQSQFKGNFMLYDEANLNFNLKTTLDIKGGFLRNTPTNLPIKVKVHVYIVKIMIMNAMGFIGNGKIQPKIVLNYGTNEIKYENIKCSVEAMVGKCFEFEARFPNDALLMVSLNGGSIVPGWNDLIGQTMIDLEDRFYSNLYATCGLPKKVNKSEVQIQIQTVQIQILFQ
jgi:hypothetical protein